MKKYLHTTTKDTFLKVELYYTLGGMNYFTYKNEPRGYYLSVTPVERVVRDTYTSESFMAFSGVKDLILPVARKGKKAEAEAESMCASVEKRLVDHVLASSHLTLSDEVCA